MTDKSPSRPKQGQDQTREARLKAALKANLARRKAQARSRKSAQAVDSDETENKNKD
ncbi:hypothetical protein I5535_10585 [Rhodobacteraceae bacterium F11138]|nr:hypothetical protein [Rhodobacteraceae bacterium F11138]